MDMNYDVSLCKGKYHVARIVRYLIEFQAMWLNSKSKVACFSNNTRYCGTKVSQYPKCRLLWLVAWQSSFWWLKQEPNDHKTLKTTAILQIAGHVVRIISRKTCDKEMSLFSRARRQVYLRELAELWLMELRMRNSWTRFQLHSCTLEIWKLYKFRA